MAAIPKASPIYPSGVENGAQDPSYQSEPANESHWFLVIMNVINSLTHMLLGSITISALIFANIAEASIFKQHVYLCIFGYVILMAQAVLAFNPYNGWASNLKYPQKRVLHYVMQICGSILGIAGGSLGMSNTYFNLRTNHGIFGFIAMVLTVVSLLGGIYHLLFPAKINSVFLRTSHACVGCLTLLSAFIALCFAFSTSFLGMRIFGEVNKNLFITSTVFALIGTLVVSGHKIVKRTCCGRK